MSIVFYVTLLDLKTNTGIKDKERRKRTEKRGGKDKSTKKNDLQLSLLQI